MIKTNKYFEYDNKKVEFEEKYSYLREQTKTKTTKNTGLIYYVYTITNKKTFEKYIGFRSAINPDEDLGVIYFGSGKNLEFKKLMKKNRGNFDFEILARYDNFADAAILESFLHTWYKVNINPHFYNIKIEVLPKPLIFENVPPRLKKHLSKPGARLTKFIYEFVPFFRQLPSDSVGRLIKDLV